MSVPKVKNAEAVHLSDGQDHIVGLRHLKVLLSQEDSHWFAQGLEIDYAASGASEDDAKKRFEDGLSATIKAHLKLAGNIKGLLVVAPQSEWARYFQATSTKGARQLFSTVQICRMDKDLEGIPFDALAFLSSVAKSDELQIA